MEFYDYGMSSRNGNDYDLWYLPHVLGEAMFWYELALYGTAAHLAESLGMRTYLDRTPKPKATK